MHISDHDQQDADIDWFATDADGHILHVASGGGRLPGGWQRGADRFPSGRRRSGREAGKSGDFRGGAGQAANRFFRPLGDAPSVRWGSLHPQVVLR